MATGAQIPLTGERGEGGGCRRERRLAKGSGKGQKERQFSENRLTFSPYFVNTDLVKLPSINEITDSNRPADFSGIPGWYPFRNFPD